MQYGRFEYLMEPRQFGNYTLLERVSHGGMAEVFRAKSFGEAGFEREVALKLLLPSIASDQEFVDMLIDEAKIAGQLNHANIAQIFDLGAVDGSYYIVQEFVRGQDLRSILKHKSGTKTKLKISAVCHIAIKICEGLHYAHNKLDSTGRPLNLVHRDISPHNVLISDEGEVKIIDFGIAKAEGRATQTLAGLVKGKFAYMSPEQIRGLPVDHRSDVFATGILLHEMLTSRPLFQAATEFETLKRARSAEATPPSLLNPEVSPQLDAIVLKALARHVDDRYQSARELRDDLWAFARANNAFAGHDQLTGIPHSPLSSPSQETNDDSDISILIELASEVSEVPEPRVPFPKRIAPTIPDGIETTIGDEETTTGGVGSEFVDDDCDFESRTIVDAHFADMAIPSEDTAVGDEDTSVRTDYGGADAHWAADVSGPLLSVPNTTPTASETLPKAVHDPLEEEETTTNGGAPTEAPTTPGRAAPDGDAATEAERGRRISTVPAIPPPKEEEDPYTSATTTKQDRKETLAQAQALSQSQVAQQAFPRPSGPFIQVSAPFAPPAQQVSLPGSSSQVFTAPPETTSTGRNGRLYLLMGALFVLLLAAAATLTLMIDQ